VLREIRVTAYGLTFLASVGWAIVVMADFHDNVPWGRVGLLLGGLATFVLFVLTVLWWEEYVRLRPAVRGLTLASVGALVAWALSFLHGFQLCGGGMMCDSGPFPGESVWESSVVWVGWIGLLGSMVSIGFYAWARRLRRREANDAG
jgi:drug/metabolite transporter (DMT)-like permease